MRVSRRCWVGSSPWLVWRRGGNLWFSVSWSPPSMMEMLSIQTIYIINSVQFIDIHMNQEQDEKAKQMPLPQSSLLDITHPYLTHSLLSRSYFYGFEVLVFLLACHFPIIYMILNFINKGYLLKTELLQTITSNLAYDVLAFLLLLILALAEIYIFDLVIKLKMRSVSIVYAYCIFWMVAFVSVGLYFITSIDFEFTDRILIVVCSWIIPVKVFSYCLDRINNSPKATILIALKYILSPAVIYKQFLDWHTPTLKIHKTYLVIKTLTAIMCLLINYILVTEIIGRYLEPQVYQSMSYAQLCFRLTPLFFFEHMVLYYLIMENILLALAELTQLKNRKFYSDWWNAQTVSEFLDKWVLLINSFSDNYLPLRKRTKHCLHVSIIFLMLFSIFSSTVTYKMFLFAGLNIGIVFFWSQSRSIQNNYLVHLLTVCFQPLTLAAALKYDIFK